MRVILTGAQGTGKTTVLNELAKDESLGLKAVTEMVRNLHKNEGIAVNENGDAESQRRIFDACMELTSQDNIVADRGLTDVMAYTYYLSDFGKKFDRKISDEMYARMYDEYFLKEDISKNVIIFYFPIEFPVVGDGFRSEDEDFRTTIDKIINVEMVELMTTILPDGRRIPVYDVRGTVEERVNFIKGKIKEHLKV